LEHAVPVVHSSRGGADEHRAAVLLFADCHDRYAAGHAVKRAGVRARQAALVSATGVTVIEGATWSERGAGGEVHDAIGDAPASAAGTLLEVSDVRPASVSAGAGRDAVLILGA